MPACWVLMITMFAGWQKLFSDVPAIGFLAHADVFVSAIARGEILAPATTMAQMQAVVFNDRINAFMTVFFMVVVVTMVVFAIRSVRQARNTPPAVEADLAQGYA